MPIESLTTSSMRPLRRSSRRLLRRLAVRRRRVSRTPFARLVSHFIMRLTGSEDSSGESRIGSGALLGLLAAPGAFLCFLLLDNYSTLMSWFRGTLNEDLFVTSAADKFLFISAAMVVTGIVTVLKWDRILPGAQDFLNLAPLPVRPHSILLANAVAIALAVLVFSVTVSAIPSFLFPMIICAAADTTMGGFAQFVATHAFCVVLSCIFTFCTVFAVLGTISAVLTRNAFRAISSALRAVALIAFLTLLLSGFAGPQLLKEVTARPESPLHWLPSLWFVSLYQCLQHRATPALAAMARLAWQGMFAAFGVMLAAYAVGYRRRFAAVLESGGRSSRRMGERILIGALDLFAPRAAGFGRASFRFVVRALMQDEEHRLCLAVAVGLGWLLAVQNVAGARAGSDVLPAIGVLAAPLTAAYLLILGLRVALEMPVTLPANWAFRIVLDPKENETAFIARRVLYAFLVLFVLAPCLAFSLWRLSPGVAVLHTLYVLALSAFLVELLLTNYRKMPLGCPTPGFRQNLLMLCLLQLFYFLAFTRVGAASERWMFGNPWRFALVPLVLGSLWFANQYRLRLELREGDRESGMAFDNPLDPAMERLKLFEE